MALPNSYERAATWFTNEMVPFLYPLLSSRQLFNSYAYVPEGKTQIQFDRIAQMQPAQMSYTLPDDTIKRDFVGISSDSIKIPFIYQGFMIDQDKLRAFSSEGKDLPTAGMEAAAISMSVLENNFLVNAYTPKPGNTAFQGLYASAGNILSSSYSFLTPGMATEAAAAAVSMAHDSYIEGVNFNMVLANDKFEQLQASFMGTSQLPGVVSEWDRCLKIINCTDGAAPGRIIRNPFLANGTGMMTPVDTTGRYMKLVVGYNPQNVIGFSSTLTEKLSPVYVTSFEAVCPWIKYPTAIVAMPNL